MVGVKYGTDSWFFGVLKKKFAEIDTFQKYGVLTFDKVHVQKEMQVNSKTMTYAGYTDFGDKSEHQMNWLTMGWCLHFVPLEQIIHSPLQFLRVKDLQRGLSLPGSSWRLSFCRRMPKEL